MPALQVVDAMLATLGNKHTTATHQVHFIIAFFPLLTFGVLGLGIFIGPWVNDRHPAKE